FMLAALRVVAILLFGAAALATKDFILSLLAVVTALTLPASIRTARLERAVTSDRSDQAADPLHHIFERMRALDLSPMSLASKIIIARQVLQRVGRTPQSATSTAAWCSAYAGGLVAGVIGCFAALPGPMGGEAAPRPLAHVVSCTPDGLARAQE